MTARYAVAVAALVGGMAALSASADDKKDDKDYPKLIVGKWEITKAGNPRGAQAGTTLDLTKDGKVKLVVVVGDRKIEGEGTYKLDKDKLTAKFTVMGQEGEEVSVIKKLTADALEIEDKDGGVDVLKKVKDKKDEKKERE